MVKNERKQKEAEEMWPEMRNLSYRDLSVVRHGCASSTCQAEKGDRRGVHVYSGLYSQTLFQRMREIKMEVQRTPWIGRGNRRGK